MKGCGDLLSHLKASVKNRVSVRQQNVFITDARGKSLDKTAYRTGISLVVLGVL